MTPPDPVRLEALLDDCAWLSDLSRRLVRDPHRAEDAAQQTWLAAVEKGPRDAAGRTPRRWLSHVLRNFVREDGRKQRARSDHERAGARSESVPPTSDVAARISVQRAVLGAVEALDEPYRSTLVARYLDGLAPREIARATGTPVKTVRTRLERGLAQLRARLGASRDGKRGGPTWLEALVPFALGPASLPLPLPASPDPLGVLIVSTQAKLAALGVTLAAGLILAWPRDPEPEARTLASARDAAAERADTPRLTRPPATDLQAADRAEVAAALPGASPPEAPANAARGFHARGRVLDVFGTPLVGIDVVREDDADEVLATSDGEGSFELDLPPEGAELVVHGPDWISPRIAHARAETRAYEVLLVASRRVRVAGRVTDAAGLGLSHVRLHLEPGMDPPVAFPLPLDRTASRTWDTESDADGRFVFDALPSSAGIPGLRLEAKLAGHRGASVPVPRSDEHGLQLVLEPLPAPTARGARQVVGHVRLASGEPARGARVRLDRLATESDDFGAFVLTVRGDVDGAADLIASLPGHVPAVLERFGEQALGDQDPEPRELVLGPAARAIAGRVVDADESPGSGWRVRLLDPTFLSHRLEGARTHEGFAGGSEDALELGGDGHFTFHGLYPRPYSLRAFHPETFATIDSGPVEAGTTDLVLRAAADAPLPGLTGTVRAHDGTPQADVSVSLGMIVRHSPTGHVWSTRESVRTDEHGRFQLEDVPRRNVFLRIEGEHIVNRRYDPAQEPDLGGELPEELELEVWRRCHVRIDWQGAGSPPDHAELLDAAGESLALETHGTGGYVTRHHQPLHEGDLHVVSTSEAAVTLVLFRDGSEVQRVPIGLRPGAATLLRP